MNLVGRCYEQGWGIARDAAAAARWYRRSAEAGYFRGQYNWATLLLSENRATRCWSSSRGCAGKRRSKGGVSMILRIPKLLSEDQLAAVNRSLQEPTAPWVDGWVTAGHQGAPVKRNEQIEEGSAGAGPADRC
jgi:TPR repeat protein